MKKLAKICVSAALVTALLLSLSACNVIRNIKENANRPAPPILDTPAEAQLADTYRDALENSVQSCEKIEEKTSLRVSEPAVSEGSGPKDTALLNASAKQLAALIMKNAPGGGKNEYTAANARETMLYAVPSGQFLQTAGERDLSVSTLSDGEGNDVTDENGEPVTEVSFASNDLRIFFRMYEETPAEDGEAAEAAHAIAEDAAVEAVFGPAREKAAVLDACGDVKDYLQVTDYTFEYLDCFVKASLDMDTDRLSGVTFEKNVAVTAQVTGAGPLADCGEFTVTFRLTETTDYSFHYPEEE